MDLLEFAKTFMLILWIIVIALAAIEIFILPTVLAYKKGLDCCWLMILLSLIGLMCPIFWVIALLIALLYNPRSN